MKKLLVNIMCIFIPSRKLRSKLRNKLNKKTHSPITNDLTNNIKTVEAISRLNTCNILHRETFLPYKNKFAGKTVVLCACGPTLNDYTPIPNAIHIGLNRAFKLESVDFDYMFAIDNRGIADFMDEFINYRADDCIKFIGDQQSRPELQIPESVFVKIKNARKYKTNLRFENFFPDIPTDIDIMPLFNGASVAIQAMQFILYTNPDTIYLVGCDNNMLTSGHFVNGQSDKKTLKEVIEKNGIQLENRVANEWAKIKEFAELHYPDTKIISINPVGLRGLFQDLNQKEI